MRISRVTKVLLTAVACVCASAGVARAQHCWPAMVGLVVRDSAGAVMDPGALDSIAYAPLPSPRADFVVRTWRVPPARSRGLAKEGSNGLTTLLWAGRGYCRVDIDEVVIREGGREMRLRMAVRVNSRRSPGGSVYLIDLPPFQAGTFELPWDNPAGGDDSEPALIPASRWRRVDGAG
jgi:hypothetical protein